eukprot:TRINITY_DN964_c0_g1_i16.p1 TRINITY_DN964_c0_g1~~TRINITY_DN964_c0_g1_i16.p1  ORF type:complete len:122 (-),score=46.27 TRINITY_DN964_c0_g1_i16:215-580(-)
MVYFLKGALPWQGLHGKDRKDKHEKIKAKKVGTGVNKLCEGLFEELAVYIKYCRAMKFEEAPNYSHIRKLLGHRFNEEKYTMDYQFDWEVPRDLKKESDNEAIKLMLKRAEAEQENEEKSK